MILREYDPESGVQQGDTGWSGIDHDDGEHYVVDTHIVNVPEDITSKLPVYLMTNHDARSGVGKFKRVEDTAVIEGVTTKLRERDSLRLADEMGMIRGRADAEGRSDIWS
ncbi:MAG: hypothetical protein ABIH92_03835 [Nanoarchaeota archaeon]